VVALGKPFAAKKQPPTRKGHQAAPSGHLRSYSATPEMGEAFLREGSSLQVLRG